MSLFVLSCVNHRSADKGNILYYYDSSNSFVGMGGTMRHYESGSQVQNDKEYLERVAATVYGSWDYTQDTELYKYYLSLGRPQRPSHKRRPRRARDTGSARHSELERCDGIHGMVSQRRLVQWGLVV